MNYIFAKIIRGDLMNKAIFLLASGLVSLQLSGCASYANKDLQAFTAEDLNDNLRSGQFIQKTQSFLVLQDASSSMAENYLNARHFQGSKQDVAHNLLNAFNLSIPELPLQAGLRSFGFGPCTDWTHSVLRQSISEYNKAGFQKTLASVECASGGTPLADSLATSVQDLEQAKGNIALIVFSDGEDESSPLTAVESLKLQYGERLCIHTVWIGNPRDAYGKANLQQIAQASECGIAATAEQIATPAGMKQFVQRIFLDPVTKAADDDQDGVENAKDKCPDTPKGALVDADGCWTSRDILFDFDSKRIKASYSPVLNNVATVMQANPNLHVTVEGHTDSTGKAAYNQKLSEQRANAVTRHLIDQGVDASRLKAQGLGESRPVASNATREGRASNRRVVYQALP